MKICILGDTHFGARGDSLDFHNYFKRFYDEVFFPYLLKYRVNTIFQLGDLFDRRKFINFNSLYQAKKYFFDVCQQHKIEVYALVGNHDIAYKNTLEVNSPSLLLRDYENVHIIEDFYTNEFHGVSMDFIPWLCDENEASILQKMKDSKSQICFGHFEIAGFEMDKGVICDVGIDKSILNKYDIVLSGHFHHKSTKDNITYVGTPYEMTWADYKDNKGFHIFDTTNRELEFVPNPYDMFVKIYYDDTNQDFDWWKGYDFESLKNTYVKVVVVNKQNPYLFDHVIDNVYKASAADIAIVEDFNDALLDADDDLIDQAEDTITILNKYIDNLQLDIESDKLKTIMRELYVEALNTEVSE
jgi:DNA repair exonuclease SbcCD nuclease subunit